MNRLKSAGLKSRKVITSPMLSDRHQRLRLAWCLARRGFNLRTWRGIHWSDESRFLLNVTVGRIRVWWQNNTPYTIGNIQPTVPYGGGSVMICGCISHDCKLGLVTIRGNLTCDQYIRDILQSVVVLHIDNHPQAARPVFMDDNASVLIKSLILKSWIKLNQKNSYASCITRSTIPSTFPAT
jgi:hypothetical protein